MPATCRLCDAILTETFVDLGMSPLCESFVPAERLDGPETFYPLHVRICSECLLVQLPAYVPGEEIFSDYAYFSSYSDSWVAHAKRYADAMVDRLGLGPDSLVAEVASNDGYLLQHFVAAGIPVVGIEPAANIAEVARAKGVRTEVRFLGADTGAEIAERYGRADLVAGNNVYAHVPDIRDFTAGLAALVKPTGLVTLEFPHLLRLIEGRQYDTIYHEHYQYLSLLTATRALATGGLKVVDVEELPTHGGSLRVHARPVDAAGEPSATVKAILDAEATAGLDTVEGHAGFARAVFEIRNDLMTFLLAARADGRYGRGLRRTGEGKHHSQPLRYPVGSARLHSGPQSVQAREVSARHAHPHPRAGPDRCGPPGLRPGAPLEPPPGDHEPAVVCRRLGRPAGVRGAAAGGGRAMKVVLFCGGLGMRMREGAASAPKPMNLIGDRPLLWHVMRYYAHFGHTDFILCLGYGSAAVKEYFLSYNEAESNDFTLVAGGRDIQLHRADITNWNISFIDTGLNSTIGERLMRVRQHVEGEEAFLANYADTLTDAPLDQLVDRFLASDASASMLAVPPVSSHHVVEMDEAGRVTGVREVRELLQWENGGYFILRPGIFDVLRDGEDMVPDAFSRLAGTGGLLAQQYNGFWRAADTFKDKVELEEMFQTGQCPWMLWDPHRNGVTPPVGHQGNGRGAASDVALIAG